MVPAGIINYTSVFLCACAVTTQVIFYSSECAFDGLAQLSQLGFGNTSAVLWWNIFSLVVYALVCMLLAYMILRLIKKEK